MDVAATYTFEAPRKQVWSLLIDPLVIAACLPGCESLEPVGEDIYHAVLTIGIAAVSGRFEGTVTISDKDSPSHYRLLVDGKGKTGFVKGHADVTLTDQGLQTVVTVVGRAQVGGTVARVGQRLLGSVSKMMMDRFFTCLEQKSRGKVDA